MTASKLSTKNNVKMQQAETLRDLDDKLVKAAEEYNKVDARCQRFNEVQNLFAQIKDKGGQSAVPKVLVDEIDLSQNDRVIDISGEEFIALKESIKDQGLLQRPILTLGISSEKPFLCVAGHRRILALKALGIQTCPAELLYSESSSKIQLARLAENVVRQNLKPLDLAESIFRLKKELQESTSGISRILSKNRTYVIELLKIAEWPDEAKFLARKHDLKVSDLTKIAKRKLSETEVIERVKVLVKQLSDHPTGRKSETKLSDHPTRKKKSPLRKDKFDTFCKRKNYTEVQRSLIFQALSELGFIETN